jgi:hypothetical protein
LEAKAREIEAVRCFKQSVKQFEGKTRNKKPEVKSLILEKPKVLILLLVVTFGWSENIRKQ